MFENVLKPKSKKMKVTNPFSEQPSYDSKKDMFHGGEYYGTGIKTKVGKIRGDGNVGEKAIPQKSFKVPPKSLA